VKRSKKKKNESKENHIVFIIIKPSLQITHKQQVNMENIFMQQQKHYKPYGCGLKMEPTKSDCNSSCYLISNPYEKLSIVYVKFSPSPGQAFWQQFQTALF